MTASGENTAQAVRSELEAARAEFHAILESMPEQSLRRRSKNPGWTNGEILFHMMFGFMILSSLIPLVKFFSRSPPRFSRSFAAVLNGLTWGFNLINAAGARGGGRFYTGRNIGRKYDRVHNSLLKRLARIKETEWQHGMYYPKRWDSLFDDYMTLEKLFRYPVVHFRFHTKQLSP